MNVLDITGKVVKEPRVSRLKGGNKVANFKILNKEPVYERGESSERSLYLACVAWNDLAEEIDKSVDLHDTINITGTLIYSSWGEGKNKQSTFKVVVNEFTVSAPELEEPIEEIPMYAEEESLEKVPF